MKPALGTGLVDQRDLAGLARVDLASVEDLVGLRPAEAIELAEIVNGKRAKAFVVNDHGECVSGQRQGNPNQC